MQAGVESHQKDRTSRPAPWAGSTGGAAVPAAGLCEDQDSGGGVGTMLENLLHGQGTAVAGHGDVTALYPGAWKQQPSLGA